MQGVIVFFLNNSSLLEKHFQNKILFKIAKFFDQIFVKISVWLILHLSKCQRSHCTTHLRFVSLVQNSVVTSIVSIGVWPMLNKKYVFNL